jgi:hypothetical protein
MNEFNQNPQPNPTKIGNEKPFSFSETIILNPELHGNDNVETDHILTLEPGHQVSDMIEEAKALAETSPENHLEESQIQLPEEVNAEVSVLEANTPVVLEKKTKVPLFAGAAAGLAVLLGGLGISGILSGKKPEMGMTDQAPKVEQANTATNTPTINYFEHSSNSGAGVVQADKPSSLISGTVAPIKPTMGENNDEAGIQELMRTSHMSRERAEATYAQIKATNNSPEAKAKQQALRAEEFTERPGYAEQLAKMDAENKANLQQNGTEQSKDVTMTIAMADGSKRQESIASVTSRRELTQSERDTLLKSRHGTQVVINNGKISVLIAELGGTSGGRQFNKKIITIEDSKPTNTDYRTVSVNVGKANTGYDIDLNPIFGNSAREVRISVSDETNTNLAYLIVTKN